MRVRKLIIEPKTQKTDTRWRTSDLQPRYAPIFPRTRPIRAGWQWRSAKVRGEDNAYILLAHCNPNRAKWQSVLILEGDSGHSVVARYEDHADHPGIHAHTDCERSGIGAGPDSLDDLLRIPSANAHHRRRRAWTPEEFWETSKRFFRVSGAPGSDEAQGSLPL